VLVATRGGGARGGEGGVEQDHDRGYIGQKMDGYFHQRRKLEFSVVECADSGPGDTNLPELPP
jgi:hypothetical protein